MLIPGGHTKYIQAPDLLRNKSFKGMSTELCDEWLASGVQESTWQGNLKPLPRKLIVEWIMDSWNKLGEDIEKLLKACVLNLNIDGSEDSVDGYEKLQQQVHVLKDSTFNANLYSESCVKKAALEINLINMDENFIFLKNNEIMLLLLI